MTDLLGRVMTDLQGVDYAFSTPDIERLALAGKSFVMRYVGPGSVPKHLTLEEARSINDAGMFLVALAEGTTDAARGGYNVGVEHATSAKSALEGTFGQTSCPIYFAVDFDVLASEWNTCAAYLMGAASVVGKRRVGVYGSYNAVRWAARDEVAAYFFQTYAWSGGMWFGANHVEQYKNGAHLAGGVVDLCRAKSPDYGQWKLEGEDVALDPGDLARIATAVWGATFGTETAAQRLLQARDYSKVAALGVGDVELSPEQVSAIVAGINDQVRAIVRDEINKTRLTGS